VNHLSCVTYSVHGDTPALTKPFITMHSSYI